MSPADLRLLLVSLRLTAEQLVELSNILGLIRSEILVFLPVFWQILITLVKSSADSMLSDAQSLCNARSISPSVLANRSI